jgi:hypothetical protein
VKAETRILDEESGFSNRQPHLRHAARKDFFLVHVEGDFYGLIQLLDLAGIARAH